MGGWIHLLHSRPWDTFYLQLKNEADITKLDITYYTASVFYSAVTKLPAQPGMRRQMIELLNP